MKDLYHEKHRSTEINLKNNSIQTQFSCSKFISQLLVMTSSLDTVNY